MGTPIDPPPPPGNQCATCWGANKKYFGKRQPKYILAIFDGVNVQERNCDDDNLPPIPSIPNHIEILLKQAFAPCKWENNWDLPRGMGWMAFLEYFAGPGALSTLFLGRVRADTDCEGQPTVYADYLFQCPSTEACATNFSWNEYEPPVREGIGGAGHVWWLP